MDTATVIELANKALALANDEDWGSEAQIDAENAFAAAAQELMTPAQIEDWESYCLKATSEEIIKSGLEIVMRSSRSE